MCAATHSQCTTKHCYSSPCAATGLSPSPACRSRHLLLLPDISACADCTAGCSPFARRYYGNPCWFLFLPLLICLIPRGHRALHIRARAVAAAARAPVAVCCALPRTASLEIPCAASKKPRDNQCDPAAGSPTATLLRLVSHLEHNTHSLPLVRAALHLR